MAWVGPQRHRKNNIQGGSNMTGTDLCVNKPHAVPVIFEPPCVCLYIYIYIYIRVCVCVGRVAQSV